MLDFYIIMGYKIKVVGAWRSLVQQCIIHQIRNTTKFVSYKDIKALMADLKRVYAAVDEQTALSELDSFDEKWSSKYPKIAISWRAN